MDPEWNFDKDFEGELTKAVLEPVKVAPARNQAQLKPVKMAPPLGQIQQSYMNTEKEIHSRSAPVRRRSLDLHRG